MAIVSKNQPCPCGSGKKYKRCCEKLMDQMNKPQSVKLSFNVVQFYTNYDFTQLLNWLQALLCFPGNQQFINRIEFMIAQLFQIPLKEFKGATVDKEVILELVTKTKESYDKLFYMYEDFTEHDQRKIIPLFFNGNRYYFFFGNLERPYENYIDLITRYGKPPFAKANGLEVFNDLLTSSLFMQTEFLKKIVEQNPPPPETENEKESETQDEATGEFPHPEIEIPDQSFIDISAAYFGMALPAKDLCKKYSVIPGFLASKKTQDIYTDGVTLKLFTSKLFVETPQGMRWFAPQFHVKAFMDIGRTLMQQGNREANLRLQLKENVIRQAHFAFTRYYDVLTMQFAGNVVVTEADHLIFHNHNKLVVFVVADYSWTDNIGAAFETALIKADAIRSNLLSKPTLTITTPAKDNKTIETYKTELLFFVIYDPVTFNHHAILKNQKVNLKGVFPLSFTDMCAVFSELEKGEEIVKFVKEEKRIRDEAQVTPGEYMERLAFYLFNGNSFHRSGRSYSGIFFAPHMWHDYIHDKLWKQSKDEDFYLEVQRKTKDYYNQLEKIGDNVFRLTDTSVTSGAFLIKINRFFWWIALPEYAQELEDLEFRVGYNILGMLYKEHIEKSGDRLKGVLPGYAADFARCTLVLLPVSRMINSFAFLKAGYVPDSATGMYFRSIRFPSTNELTTFLIYDTEVLWPHFSKDDNSGERLCIERYIYHLLKLDRLTEEEAVSESVKITDSIIPVGPRRYGMGEVSTFNQKIGWYNQPLKPSESDFGPVSRFISTHLIKENIESGEYTGHEAQAILERLYLVLLNEVESRIAGFDKSFLLFAYKQVELAEGNKQRERLMLTMKANAPLDYDVKEQYRKDDSEMSVLTISQRFLLHAGLKVSPNGEKILSNEEWTSLLALAKLTIETSLSYENIMHNLRTEKLVVSEDHILTMEQIDKRFDAEAYQQSDASRAVDYYVSKGTELSRDTKADIPGQDDEKNGIENVEVESLSANTSDLEMPATDEQIEKSILTKMLPSLNEAFLDEMGFSFEDLNFVLHALSSLPFDQGDFYPVLHIDKDKLMAGIAFLDKLGMKAEQTSAILDYITMEEGCFAKDNLLLQGKMLRYKERLLVSPVVKLKDETLVVGPQCAHNALMNWHNIGKGIFIYDLPDNSPVMKVVRTIHKQADLLLEENVYAMIKQFLPPEKIAFRLINFKRISRTLPPKPPCGEIDILCANADNKTVFVVEVKNVIKRPSNYHVSNNIVQFFTSGSSYYSKLLKKKNYISKILPLVLSYFGIADTEGWKVKEVFVSNDLQFAAFYQQDGIKADFIMPHQLHAFLQAH